MYEKKPSWVHENGLSPLKWFAISALSVYSIFIAFFVVLSDPEKRWPAGLFFEVPVLLFSRIIWKSVKVGKDGVDLSDEIEIATEKAVVAVASQVKDEQSKSQSNERVNQATGEVVMDILPATSDSSKSTLFSRLDEFDEIEAEEDPTILFVKVRATIEHEIRRMARLAGLLKLNTHPRSHRVLLANLASYNLVSRGVYEALTEILIVANKVVRRVIKLDDINVADMARVSREVVDGLSSIPLLPSWVETAVYVRALCADRDVKRSSLVEKLNSADMFVDNVRIKIKFCVDMEMINQAANTNTKALLISVAEIPRESVRELSLRLGVALAWADGQQFRGNDKAVKVAPWLFE